MLDQTVTYAYARPEANHDLTVNRKSVRWILNNILPILLKYLKQITIGTVTEKTDDT